MDKVQFKLRIPAALHQELVAASDENDCSVTEEILRRLRLTFDRDAMLADVRRVLSERAFPGCESPVFALSLRWIL